jgi:hypothetical protein
MQPAISYDPLDWTPSDVANNLQIHHPDHEDSENSFSPSLTQMLNSSSSPYRTRQPSGWMRDYFASTVILSMESTYYAEACQSEEWRAACDEEMGSIYKNDT